MKFRIVAVAVVCLLGGMSVPAVTVKENFREYSDFDSAHHRWMFRGVGGEVIDGEYRFNGVSIEEPIQPDIRPLLVLGMPRDFPAGPALQLEAEIAVGRRGYSFLPAEGKFARRIGVAILPQPFSRGHRDPANLPAVLLTLDREADGRRAVRFGCEGKLDFTPERKVLYDAGNWRDDVVYRFMLSLEGELVSGTISDEAGKVLYRAELRGSGFPRVFRTAYPAFANLRQEGAIRKFRAENNGPVVKEAPLIPRMSSWQVVINGTAKSVRPDSRCRLDIGKLAGGHGLGRRATITFELDSPRAGTVPAEVQGDWFWKLSLNGKSLIDLSRKGNGSGKIYSLDLPLLAGKNRMEAEVGSGSEGWSFRFRPFDAAMHREQQSAARLYGSDRILWNIDRLFDDERNLARHGVRVPALAGELAALRRRVPEELSCRDTGEYDQRLAAAFRKVYDGYRILHFADLQKELKAIAQITGREEKAGNKLAEQEQAMRRAFAAGKSADFDRIAAEAAQQISLIRDKQEGFREGVTFGRSFGRFGWMTGDRVSRYSSGDGLLANQVLASGALLRQYVTSADGKRPWRVNFRFSGDRDAAKAAELGALPKLNSSGEVKFGYDPSSFYSGSTPKEVVVRSCNWIRKQFSFGADLTIDMSLASPALLLESPCRLFSLEDPTVAPPTHFGYRDREGKIISRKLGNGVIYDRRRDGELGRNWILFWSENNAAADLAGHRGSVPLALYFQYQPERIERSAGRVTVTLGRNGALWLDTPFGARIQPAGNWHGNLPPAAAGRCDVHAQAALAYPVEAREFYRLREDGQLEIVNHFSYRLFEQNSWNLVPRKFAPLPPVLTLMKEHGFDAVLPGGTVKLGYPTIYGPLAAVEGERVCYTLPVPAVGRMTFPRNLAAEPARVAELVRENEKWIEGNRYRNYCENIARNWYSIRDGLGHPVKAWQYLPGEFREYLTGLFQFETQRLSSYRLFRYWRSLVEPYTGSKYFYSFSISCRAPGDVGIFGDRGYGVGCHLEMLDRITSATGDWEGLKRVWRDSAPLAPPGAVRDGETVTVDKMLGYQKGVHDWAWMDGGSNDSGDNGPVVDCAQAAYGGYASLLRMANAMRDSDMGRVAAYHLAKSQLPLIARTAFRNYGHENGLLGPDHLNAGFREFITPDSYANSPMTGLTPRNEYDGSLDSVICYALVDGFDIFFPYAKYIWNDLRRDEKIRSLYWPNRDHGVSRMMLHLYSRLVWLMIDGMPQDQALALLDHWAPPATYFRRPAVREIYPVALTGGCPLTLTGWDPLPEPEFTFDPAERCVRLRFRSVPEGYSFTGLSASEPAGVLISGENVPYRYDSSTRQLTVELPAGEGQQVEIRYSAIEPGRFAPLPLPPRPEEMPAANGLEPESFVPVPFSAAWKPSPVSAGGARETVLYRADFSGKAPEWKFHSWGRVPSPVSGGFTGETGRPPKALEICAVEHDYAGRVSPRIPLPAGRKELVLRGSLSLSPDYRGNRPRMFFWSGKSAHFFELPRPRPGMKQRFEIVLPVAKLPAVTGEILLQLVSSFTDGQDKPAGSVFFHELSLSCR